MPPNRASCFLQKPDTLDHLTVSDHLTPLQKFLPCPLILVKIKKCTFHDLKPPLGPGSQPSLSSPPTFFLLAQGSSCFIFLLFTCCTKQESSSGTFCLEHSSLERGLLKCYHPSQQPFLTRTIHPSLFLTTLVSI